MRSYTTCSAHVPRAHHQRHTIVDVAVQAVQQTDNVPMRHAMRARPITYNTAASAQPHSRHSKRTSSYAAQPSHMICTHRHTHTFCARMCLCARRCWHFIYAMCEQCVCVTHSTHKRGTRIAEMKWKMNEPHAEPHTHTPNVYSCSLAAPRNKLTHEHAP